eukprot:7422499-Alexandrium_andersonii.AAC.1
MAALSDCLDLSMSMSKEAEWRQACRICEHGRWHPPRSPLGPHATGRASIGGQWVQMPSHGKAGAPQAL